MISPDALDQIFSALADPTRRAILTRLSQGEASVQELKQPFEISQPAISRHLKVLEKAGLIDRSVSKQTRPARIRASRLSDATNWLVNLENYWNENLDQMEDVINKIQLDERREQND